MLPLSAPSRQQHVSDPGVTHVTASGQLGPAKSLGRSPQHGSGLQRQDTVDVAATPTSILLGLRRIEAEAVTLQL